MSLLTDQHAPPHSPLREMLAIAAPSVVTMASYTAMQFVDKLMVSRIGPEPIYVAAQGNAGIVTWTLMTFSVGVSGVVSSFVSQNLGAGRPERGAAYAWNGMHLALLWWVLIMLPGAALIPHLYALTDHEPEVRAMETHYAQIAMAGALFTLMSKALHNYFFGMHRPKVVAVAVIIGNAVNILASMMLIFGPEGLPTSDGPIGRTVALVADPLAGLAGTIGLPAMGVAGAAIGTVIGTFFELAIPLIVFLGPRYNREYHTRAPWRPNAACVKDLFRIGWPAGAMFINDLICWSYLTVVLLGLGGRARAEHLGLGPEEVERAGTIANTAGYIGLQFMHLSFMPAVGISIATQALVGKAIGAGRPGDAADRAMLGLKLAMGYMGLCALGFFVFRESGITLFLPESTSPEEAAEVVAVGAMVMIAAAVFQVFDAVAIVFSAALRGAGDTVWPGLVSIVLSYAFVIGAGHLLVELRPEWGSVGPWIGASTFIILLAVVLTFRFAQGKWKTMKLTHDDDLHHLPPDENIPGPGPEVI
ncbi:MAG: MATE family efflux transporter [Phycisphaerales bacterium JB040]